MDYALHETRLEQAIAQARHKKQEAKSPPKPDCKHEYKLYKQSLMPANERFQGLGAHFTIKGCARCKAKQYIDYVVER